MRMLRVRGVVAVVCALTFGLAACSTGDAEADDRPLVVTTFTVLADMAENVAGDHLRIESVTKFGAEIHGYEPTPSDLRRVSGADLVLDNGLGLERWFEQFTADIDAPRVTLSDGLDPIDIADDAYAGQPNPHAWMSPVEAQVYVDNIVEAFTELDPANANDFASNGEAYKAELQTIHDELVAAIDQVPEASRALVTCEGAFSYLARDAGLTEQYIWPVNAENQATPQQVAAVITYVTDNEVPAVFCESTVSDSSMQQVVSATNTTYGGELFVDSLTTEDGPVPTYLDLLRYDTELIADALTSAGAGD